VLVAAGVGITPIMSVLRYLTDKKWDGDIFVILSFRTGQDFIYSEEIGRLEEQHSNLHVEVTLTRPDDTWSGPRGRIDKELIADFVPDIAERLIHICGPEHMMRDVQAMTMELGVPEERIRIEAFGTAKRVPGPKSTDRAGDGDSTFTVTFCPAGESAPLPADESILDVADSIGVEIDNACRSGTCGSCKVKLVAGSVSMDCQMALDEEEKSQGIILACQAKAQGDVEIEI
jgi:ferredoxin-NADP reductase